MQELRTPRKSKNQCENHANYENHGNAYEINENHENTKKSYEIHENHENRESRK